MSGVLLESRPFRPFKSSEEYLYAMKEDLAEWLQTLYPHLAIATDNFMERLETGVTLCEHANAVKAAAGEYVRRKVARRQPMGGRAQAHALLEIAAVKYRLSAKAGTFFARDNLSNFIRWCRDSLRILECLLFESDDLIMRKNEKHVILCLLEVARRGARFGMLAPMLVQMERQIDREIAAEQRTLVAATTTTTDETSTSDSELDDEDEDEMDRPMLMYGPIPQIVTNDLKSLDEMVRDLVERCTCATQFPMIRVSEGKYRIGDTKVLIFVRILRNHVMVRVGGGWDTLSHYLDKHDPCRCRSQHRSTQSARLINRVGGDLHGAQVLYERAAASTANTPTASPLKGAAGCTLGPPMNALNRSRSRSPSTYRRSASPYVARAALVNARSRSPTPHFVSTHSARLRKSASAANHVALLQIPPTAGTLKTEAVLHVSGDSTDHSDNASEVSDEGYRSLGVTGEQRKHRVLLQSQMSIEDADESERHQESDQEADTNNCGLRKTAFSLIYEPSAVSTPKKSASVRNLAVSTWNGRQRSRPSLSGESFAEFARNAPTRRSTSVPKSSEGVTSSPPSRNIKDELKAMLMRTGSAADSNEVLLIEVDKLLKQYNFRVVEDNGERMRTRRKDSKPENSVSRIPAPIRP